MNPKLHAAALDAEGKPSQNAWCYVALQELADAHQLADTIDQAAFTEHVAETIACLVRARHPHLSKRRMRTIVARFIKDTDPCP